MAGSATAHTSFESHHGQGNSSSFFFLISVLQVADFLTESVGDVGELVAECPPGCRTKRPMAGSNGISSSGCKR